MAVIRALPRAIGTYDLWTLAGGANKIVAVQTDDGDTTTVTDTGGNKRQSYFMDLMAGFLFSVSSITVSGKAKHTTSGAPSSTQQGIKQGATDTIIQSIGGTTSYVLTTSAARNTSALGAAWTPAIVDLTECYIFSQTTDDAPVFIVTWVYFDVTGVPFAGGIAQLIAALGPLVAVGLHEMPKLVRHLARVTMPHRILIEPHEIALAWREMREDRHPRYFCMPSLEVI